MTERDPSRAEVTLDTVLAPSILVPVAAVVVLVLGAGIGGFTIRAGIKKAQTLDAWARAAYSIWTGGEDSATWSRDRAQTSLRNWYGASGSGQLLGVIDDLVRGQTGNEAWDKVRALDLVRIGLAAGYLDEDQARGLVAKIARTLQATYRSWDQLAQEFELGMSGWHRRRNVTDPAETLRVQRNLPKLRAQIWPSVAFTATLASPDD